MPFVCGMTFAKIAPFWISARVRALRSLTRSRACNSLFSFSVTSKYLRDIMFGSKKPYNTILQ